MSTVPKLVTDAAPTIDLAANLALYRKVYASMNLLSSAHDLSDGGLLVAIAESMIGGGLGVALTAEYDFAAAFAEAPGRILVSVSVTNKSAFEKVFGVLSIGTVTEDMTLVSGNIRIALDKIDQAWRKGF